MTKCILDKMKNPLILADYIIVSLFKLKKILLTQD